MTTFDSTPATATPPFVADVRLIYWWGIKALDIGPCFICRIRDSGNSILQRKFLL